MILILNYFMSFMEFMENSQFFALLYNIYI